jgi:hypothetical protein
MEAETASLIAQLVAIVKHPGATSELKTEAITQAFEIGVIEGKLLATKELRESFRQSINEIKVPA